MIKLYKVKRLSDGKFYRGKSKFTKHGTYFRIEQIMQNIDWVMRQCPDDNFELIPFSITEEDPIVVNNNIKSENFIEIIERDKKIDDLLNEN
jgi:hypothetical protein